MKPFASLGLASLVLSLASPALAQRTIAQDTMSMSTPVAVECGFCAMEAYGEIFQRVGASGGLTPADFPLVVQSISLALGAAEVTSGACHGIASPADPDTLVHVEMYAGGTPPDAASIASMPVAGTPWPGEDMLLSLDDIPVTMSIPTTDGAANFNLMFNTLALGDATTPAPTVSAGHQYLRVVVVLADGGNSSTCTPAMSAPTGFPLRDDDGVVANHRSFLYANGTGWLWNEVAGVHGDWGIRLSVTPLPHDDAGPIDTGSIDGGVDASSTVDASALDAGRDASLVAGGGGSSCSCRVGRTSSSPAWALLALLALGYSRKVTRPKRAGTWKSPSSGADQASPH